MNMSHNKYYLVRHEYMSYILIQSQKYTYFERIIYINNIEKYIFSTILHRKYQNRKIPSEL